jgi:DNA-binding transcriptional ArsR family regulator
MTQPDSNPHRRPLSEAELLRMALKARQDRNIHNIPGANSGKQSDSYSTEQLNAARRQALFNRLVERRLNFTFQALADPTRRAMLKALAERHRSIGELAAPLAMSFAGASKHVRALEQAGLITRERAGRRQICRLNAEVMVEASDWLRFLALDARPVGSVTISR